MNEDLLSAYLDDELTPDERASVDARLAESADWRAVLADVGEARDAVRALPARDAPAAWWDEVLAAGTGPAVVDLASERHARRSRPRRWAGVAGAAAAAAILGVAIVPGEDRVQPDVATFVDAHAVRSSADNDVISNVAGATVEGGVLAGGEPRP